MLAVVQFFSEHYTEPFTIPELSRLLDLSLLQIETAFDRCKGKTTNQALLDYRLNRLCDLMGHDPSADLNLQIRQCGLASFPRTNHQFSTCFGIDLIEYHQQCCLAEAARLHRAQSQGVQPADEVVGAAGSTNQLLTRFHNPW